MKKILSFLILFIPWSLSLLIIPLNKINIFYIIISIIFYFILGLYLYKTIKLNNYNNNFILNTTLLYITTQSFNICLFYYKYTILAIILFISIIFILYKLKNT